MSLLPSEPDTSAAEETQPRVVDLDSEDADDVLSALTSETAREVLSALHEEPAPPAELADRVDTSLQNAQYHLNKLEDAGAVEVIDQIYSEKGREMNVYAPADRPLVIFAGDDDQSTGLRAALSRLLGSLGILAFASVAIQEIFGDGVANLFGGTGGGGGPTDRGAAPGPAPAGENGTATPTPDPNQYQGTNGTESGGDIGIASEPSTTAEKPELTNETVEAARSPPEPTTTDEATRTASEAVNTTAQNASDATAAALALEPGVLFFLGGLTALAVVAAVWYATK